MAAAFAAIYFLNLKGDILIQRVYKEEVDKTISEVFRTQILNAKDREHQIITVGPARTIGSVTFMYLRENNIYVLTVTRSNTNAICAFSFMSAMIQLFRSYFGNVNENSIKNNFVLIYELLDEVLDYGIPQLTEPQILKNFVLQRPNLIEGAMTSIQRLYGEDKQPQIATNATLQVTGAVSWRRDNIRYKNNELFVDVIETLNLTMSSEGHPLRCDVQGAIKVKCYLSGMPELKLEISENVDSSDVTLHQCVNLGRWNTERAINFVPPDGEFELMRYRATESISLPFKIVPMIKEVGRTRITVDCRVRSAFSNKLFGQNVAIMIPVPDTTSRVEIKAISAGKAKYDQAKKSIVWKIRKFLGMSEHQLMADVVLITTTRERKSWSRAPISMNFQVPMYGASGMRVKYLKVWEKSGYNAEKWLRKMVKSGDYQMRI